MSTIPPPCPGHELGVLRPSCAASSLRDSQLRRLRMTVTPCQKASSSSLHRMSYHEPLICETHFGYTHVCILLSATNGLVQTQASIILRCLQKYPQSRVILDAFDEEQHRVWREARSFTRVLQALFCCVGRFVVAGRLLPIRGYREHLRRRMNAGGPELAEPASCVDGQNRLVDPVEYSLLRVERTLR